MTFFEDTYEIISFWDLLFLLFFTSTTKVSADVKSAANSNLVKYKQEDEIVNASRSEFES